MITIHEMTTEEVAQARAQSPALDIAIANRLDGEGLLFCASRPQDVMVVACDDDGPAMWQIAGGTEWERKQIAFETVAKVIRRFEAKGIKPVRL